MKQHWATKKELSNLYVIRFGCWVALRFGRRLAQYPLFIVSLYYFLVSAAVRRDSANYLRRVLARKPRCWEIFRHIHTFSKVTLDRVYMLAGKSDEFSITPHNIDVLTSHQATGQGALFFGSHLGSFDCLRTVNIARTNIPMKIMMHGDASQQLLRSLHALDPKMADMIIEMGKPNSLLDVSAALEEGYQVGILADRVFNEEKTISVPFLGENASLPMGPLLIASLLKVPIILFFGVYAGGNRYHIYFEKFTDGLQISRENREQALNTQIAAYIQRVEYYAKQYPYNWFNFYDYWGDNEKN